jgi:hypothetical protein
MGARGYKEIEIGYSSVPQTDFDFVNALIQAANTIGAPRSDGERSSVTIGG